MRGADSYQLVNARCGIDGGEERAAGLAAAPAAFGYWMFRCSHYFASFQVPLMVQGRR